MKLVRIIPGTNLDNESETTGCGVQQSVFSQAYQEILNYVKVWGPQSVLQHRNRFQQTSTCLNAQKDSLV